MFITIGVSKIISFLCFLAADACRRSRNDQTWKSQMKTFPKMSLDPFPHQSTVHPHNLISLTHFAVFSAIRRIYFFKSFISLKVINQFLVVGNIVMFFDPAKLLVVETHPTRVLEGWRRDKSVKSRVPSYLSLPSSIASYLHALLWSLMDTRRECLMATDSEASRGSSGGIGEIKKKRGEWILWEIFWRRRILPDLQAQLDRQFFQTVL